MKKFHTFSRYYNNKKREQNNEHRAEYGFASKKKRNDSKCEMTV